MFRLPGPLADDPRARVLYGLVVGLLLWVCACLPLVTFLPQKLGTFFALLGDVLVFAITVFLLRRGSLPRASWFFLIATWFNATAVILFYSGTHTPVIVNYLVLPVVAVWLLGPRAAAGLGALCLASSLAVAIDEQILGPISHYFPGSPLGI